MKYRSLTSTARVLLPVGATYVLLLASVATADSITASAVLTSSCVIGVIAGVDQGCVAQNSYVTGNGAGGMIHTVDFNDNTAIDPNGVATYSGSFFFPAITPSGATRPTDDNSNFVAIQTGVMTIEFSQPIDYFGFYWGTPSSHASDTPDKITFNNVSGGVVTQLAQFDALDVPSLNGSDTPSGDNYVSFNAVGETFNEVLLSEVGGGNGCCFETDNHSYVIAGSGHVPPPVPGHDRHAENRPVVT